MTDSSLKEQAIALRDTIKWSSICFDNVDAVIFYGYYEGAIALANMYIKAHTKSSSIGITPSDYATFWQGNRYLITDR